MTKGENVPFEKPFSKRCRVKFDQRRMFMVLDNLITKRISTRTHSLPEALSLNNSNIILMEKLSPVCF